MSAEPAKTLVEYLPALYQEDPFAGAFLRAFEKVLVEGYDGTDGPVRGLETAIAELPTTFEPQSAPREFLAWLADWTAFTLRNDLLEDRQRDFLAKIIPLYRRRGTKENLQELLRLFLAGSISVKPTVKEVFEEFQIDNDLQVGVNTRLGGPPHFFEVTIALAQTTGPDLERQRGIAGAIINLEKPAHTHYNLKIIFPSMQVGEQCTIGVDTILGATV